MKSGHDQKNSAGAVAAGVVAFFALAIAGPNAYASKTLTTYDVMVYGATPAGVVAAVAAGREGKSVVLVEPLPLIGGILSGGMGFSDSFLMHRETLGGLFKEFHKRVEEYYIKREVKLPYQVNEENSVPWTWEPHVAERVFKAMLREADVHVMLNETLESAARQGASITSIRTQSGKRLSAKVFIDSSYEGDLLDAANVQYRIGREGREEFGESLAGVRYPDDPVNRVSALDDNGEPLPLISSTERPPEGQGDHRIMTYSFRLCLTDDAAKRVPITKPADYDPARYELFRRVYKAFPEDGLAVRGQLPSWVEASLPFDMFRIPGGKFDGNNRYNGSLSTGLVGESWDYPEADFRKRQAIWNDHRSYTEGLLYFLKTEPAVPERVRSRMQELGYCKDEFAEFGHFPPVLYVREGRRMVGEYFLTQADILERREKPDPIGIGSFPIDSHIVQRITTEDGGFINEGGIAFHETLIEGLGRPYQIPYRSIIPKSEECTNLLVPVALSASHVAYSSVRVEPTWMVLGQSAGIAASIAVEDRVPVQKVGISKLMRRLEAKGQILKLPR